jgi:hypothetical protein
MKYLVTYYNIELGRAAQVVVDRLEEANSIKYVVSVRTIENNIITGSL